MVHGQQQNREENKFHNLKFHKVQRVSDIGRTSDNNPKGTADTERLLRTLKEDALGSASGPALST
jgi:hypothetical protein